MSEYEAGHFYKKALMMTRNLAFMWLFLMPVLSIADCKVLLPIEVTTYEGPCGRDGLASGRGRAFAPSYSAPDGVWEGEFVAGKLHGRATYWWGQRNMSSGAVFNNGKPESLAEMQVKRSDEATQNLGAESARKEGVAEKNRTSILTPSGFVAAVAGNEASDSGRKYIDNEFRSFRISPAFNKDVVRLIKPRPTAFTEKGGIEALQETIQAIHNFCSSNGGTLARLDSFDQMPSSTGVPDQTLAYVDPASYNPPNYQKAMAEVHNNLLGRYSCRRSSDQGYGYDVKFVGVGKQYVFRVFPVEMLSALAREKSNSEAKWRYERDARATESKRQSDDLNRRNIELASTLKPGDQVGLKGPGGLRCAMVIEAKPPLANLQLESKQIWVRIEQLSAVTMTMAQWVAHPENSLDGVCTESKLN